MVKIEFFKFFLMYLVMWTKRCLLNEYRSHTFPEGGNLNLIPIFIVYLFEVIES